MEKEKSTGENVMSTQESRELPPTDAPAEMQQSYEEYFSQDLSAVEADSTDNSEEKGIRPRVMMISSVAALLIALVLGICLILQTNQTETYRATAQTYNTQLKEEIQKNGELNNANSGLVQQNSQLATDASSTAEQNSKLNSDVNSANQQNAKLNNDVNSANQQNSKLSHDVNTATAKANQAQADLDAKTAEVNKINAQLVGLNTQLAALNSQLSAKQADLAKAERGIAKFADLKTYLLAYDQEMGQAIKLITTGYQALLNGQSAQTYNDQLSALAPQMQQNADNINAIFDAIQNGNY